MICQIKSLQFEMIKLQRYTMRTKKQWNTCHFLYLNYFKKFLEMYQLQQLQIAGSYRNE